MIEDRGTDYAACLFYHVEPHNPSHMIQRNIATGMIPKRITIFLQPGKEQAISMLVNAT